MIYERSYGIVPLRRGATGWEVLLVRHGSVGHWSFPKGGAEAGETNKQAAERELQEETGLTVSRYLCADSFDERYRFRSSSGLIDKTVVYYAAEVTGNLVLQEQEISDSRWMLLTDAEAFLTFPEAKSILRAVRSKLS
jgi:bis(5'-nucleosidyl)-tetraphosphatase